jgi:dethiobiotin synthetase
MLGVAQGVIVAGIGTDVGKTVVSAILCERLKAYYWKPVATGIRVGPAESESVAGLLSEGSARVFKEQFLFLEPLSPHIAAALETREVRVGDFICPPCDSPLVIELAGGVMVPLNDRETNLDLIRKLALPVVVVSRHYLGSINHTLLTIEALRSAGADVRGLVFNGEELPDSERVIRVLSGVQVIGRVPLFPSMSRKVVTEFAASCDWIV